MAKIIDWIKIARLQFYLMAFIAYSIGAVYASRVYHQFDLTTYVIGYICLFLIELCSVLCNEYFDLPSDRINKNFSMFTGGSRMIVNGNIKPAQVKRAVFLILSILVVFGYILMKVSASGSYGLVVTLLIIGLFLGLGYTVPPFKFSHRGVGEIVVGITHSSYVLICGLAFQTGQWKEPTLWLISMPLFFATLAAIILSAIPDYEADKTVSKKTVVVYLGPKIAVILSIAFVAISALLGLMLWYKGIISGIIGAAILITIPNALAICVNAVKLIKSDFYNRQINDIMKMSLTYIIWFGLIPLVYLLW